MNLETLLRTIEPQERVIIVEGNLAFVDRHIYQGVNSHFYEHCSKLTLKGMRKRTVHKIESGVNLIYIFIEKENRR